MISVSSLFFLICSLFARKFDFQIECSVIVVFGLSF
jgi:hypothetical protein